MCERPLPKDRLASLDAWFYESIIGIDTCSADNHVNIRVGSQCCGVTICPGLLSIEAVRLDSVLHGLETGVAQRHNVVIGATGR